MKNDITRRNFVRTTAVATSALTLGSASKAIGYASNEKLALGWIGYGGRGTQLLADIMANHTSSVRNVAICDLKPERIALGQKVAGDPKPVGYADYHQMLEKEKLDCIIIATPPATHGQIAADVLQAGVHCFCEKPMETTVEKIDALVKVARASKSIYQIGTQRRYHPGYTGPIPMIQSGDHGKITHMQGEWHWPWKLAKHPMKERGGMLLDQCCHHFDVMTWVMNEQHPATCVSMGFSQVDQPGGPNMYSATHSSTVYQFPEGQLFSYSHLFYLPKHFQNEKLWVFTEKAGFDLTRGAKYDTGEESKRERIAIDSGGDWTMGTTEELTDFFDNVRTGGKRLPKANVETGRLSTLTGIMARMAMVNAPRNSYEPRVIAWKDLHTTTDSA